MSPRNTVVRSMHDLGLAAWFGGSLMGVVGLNGAAGEAHDPTERLRISSLGWARWAPVQLAALVVHGIGGVGLILGNRARLVAQGEGRRNTVVKTVVTAGAGAGALYSVILGRRIAQHADEGGDTVTEPGDAGSNDLAAAQRQQRIVQWIAPVLTAVVIVLAAQQGEQHRPVAGLLGRFRG